MSAVANMRSPAATARRNGCGCSARLVDSHASDVVRAIGRGNEARELLMTALLLADELDEARGSAVPTPGSRPRSASRRWSAAPNGSKLSPSRLEKPGQSA